MKKILLAIFILVASNYSYAYGPMDCVNDAVAVVPKINNGTVTKLCANASSPDPVMCYAKIPELDDGITVGISTDVCSRSTNYKQTLNCYAQAGDQGFNRGQSKRLCGGASTGEPTKCTANISKVDSEISKGIAVDVCAGSTNADKTISCYAKASSTFNRGLAVSLCSAKEYAAKE